MTWVLITVAVFLVLAALVLAGIYLALPTSRHP